MLNYFDKFKKKMELSGMSLRDEKIKNSQRHIKELFNDDASLTKGIYFWELGLNKYENKPILQIRFYDRKFSNANGETVGFQTQINTPIEVGDVIFDSINNVYWICTESFNIDGIHYQGRFTKCNWILRWQLKNGSIVNYPCYTINATQYNSGETSNKNFTIGTSQHIITLPCDKNTVELSSPQRFYLDKGISKQVTYVVTQNDTTSYNYGKGLCKVTVVECVERSNKDRPDLGVCDYFETNNDNNSSFCKIVCDTNVIKSGGDSQVFKAEFYDENGNVVDLDAEWDIVCDFKNILEVKESDNNIIISIDDDTYIDEEFLLILTDINKNHQSSLVVKIDSLL